MTPCKGQNKEHGCESPSHNQQNPKNRQKKRATTSPESALRALDLKDFSYFWFWESFQMK